jgi:hypothetical protein
MHIRSMEMCVRGVSRNVGESQPGQDFDLLRAIIKRAGSQNRRGISATHAHEFPSRLTAARRLGRDAARVHRRHPTHA